MSLVILVVFSGDHWRVSQIKHFIWVGQSRLTRLGQLSVSSTWESPWWTSVASETAGRSVVKEIGSLRISSFRHWQLTSSLQQNQVFPADVVLWITRRNGFGFLSEEQNFRTTLGCPPDHVGKWWVQGPDRRSRWGLSQRGSVPREEGRWEDWIENPDASKLTLEPVFDPTSHVIEHQRALQWLHLLTQLKYSALVMKTALANLFLR